MNIILRITQNRLSVEVMKLIIYTLLLLAATASPCLSDDGTFKNYREIKQELKHLNGQK